MPQQKVIPEFNDPLSMKQAVTLTAEALDHASKFAGCALNRDKQLAVIRMLGPGAKSAVRMLFSGDVEMPAQIAVHTR